MAHPLEILFTKRTKRLALTKRQPICTLTKHSVLPEQCEVRLQRLLGIRGSREAQGWTCLKRGQFSIIEKVHSEQGRVRSITITGYAERSCRFLAPFCLLDVSDPRKGIQTTRTRKHLIDRLDRIPRVPKTARALHAQPQMEHTLRDQIVCKVRPW